MCFPTWERSSSQATCMRVRATRLVVCSKGVRAPPHQHSAHRLAAQPLRPRTPRLADPAGRIRPPYPTFFGLLIQETRWHRECVGTRIADITKPGQVGRRRLIQSAAIRTGPAGTEPGVPNGSGRVRSTLHIAVQGHRPFMFGECAAACGVRSNGRWLALDEPGHSPRSSSRGG